MIKILEGENTFLSKQKLEELLKEYTLKNPNISIKIIDASVTKMDTILNEYDTADIFSPQKLIVLKRLQVNKNYKDFLGHINIDKMHTDLIIWEDKSIPKNTNYYKVFHTSNCIESFAKFNKRTFAKWAQERLNSKNIKITKEVLDKFLEFVNYEPYTFLNELEKILLLEKDEIDIEYLEKNTNDSYINTIWELIDSINSKDKKNEPIKILLNLLQNGLEPHYLITMIARNTRQMILINKMLEDQKTDQEILHVLKIPPFTFPKLKSIAQKSDCKKFVNLYEKIYNLDYEIKIGNIEPELGLILLTTRLN